MPKQTVLTTSPQLAITTGMFMQTQANLNIIKSDEETYAIYIRFHSLMDMESHIGITSMDPSCVDTEQD